MTELQQETTLEKVRLHWGIFVPALLIALAPILALSGFVFLARRFLTALGQIGLRFNHDTVPQSLILIWLMPAIVCFVIVLGTLAGTWLAYSKSEVILTNRRLVFRTGFLSRCSGELPLENVESIYISEPLLGRICGYGTVAVTSVGGASFRLPFIGSPQSFHAILQEAVLNAKNSVGRIPKTSDGGLPPHDDDFRYKPKA